jgi:hypothetical protein
MRKSTETQSWGINRKKSQKALALLKRFKIGSGGWI